MCDLPGSYTSCVLSISVLGPVSVRRGDDLLRIPSGKATELLVRLALEPGVVVRADRLLEELWGGDTSATRPNTLQSKVAMLRRALDDPAAIATVDGGYRLAVEPDQVDATRALAAAVSARALLDEAHDRDAVGVCAEALAWFTGDLLSGAGEGAWVGPHRARLDEVRVQLVETQSAARIRLGDLGGVISDLELFLADRPFQERAWGLLISALYQSGRQADALAAYQRVRTILRDELGLEPGFELQDLERNVLTQDQRLSPSVRHSDRRAWAGNLPALAVHLVGRDAEARELAQLVDERRLVEIVGPGGVGKTALAVEVGRQLTRPGGVWFLRLEAAHGSSEVVDATAAALGVAGGEDAVVERLRAAPTLLILDNCEHVLAAAAEWVEHLLDSVADIGVLCTSQAAMGIAGSAAFELSPLQLDDAIALFAERSASAPRRVATGDQIATLCRSLDGLPLAIELAAARTRTLSVEEISRRLGDRFGVLHDPTSRRPERRRALRSTIAWSYDLLFPDDQRGLWALATFAGSASLPAVECVAVALEVPRAATIDVLGRLAARSLLIVDHDSDGTRYRLLDSIRAFALEALAESELTDVARAAHVGWLVDAARRSTAGVRSAHQAEHLALVRDERANIDAALLWALEHDPPAGLEMAVGFGWAWVVLGDSRGAQRLLGAVAAARDGAARDGAARDGAADKVIAEALLLAGWIEASTGHLEPARRHVREAEGIARALGDVELEARAAYHLAYVVSHHGDFAEAIALTDRSRELFADLDRPWDLAANALFGARAAISAGDVSRSARAMDEVRDRLSVVDDPWLAVRGAAMLGELARLQHRFDDAVEHLADAAETSHRLGFKQTEAYQVATLGRAQCQAGSYESGAATLASAISKAEAIGDVRMAALARVHLGRVLRPLGRSDEARAALQQTAEWHRRAGGGEQALLGECLLAALDAADGVSGARGRLEVILVESRSSGDAPVEVFTLDALARCAVSAGDTATASALLRDADERMPVASHFISELDRVDAHAVRQARQGDGRG